MSADQLQVFQILAAIAIGILLLVVASLWSRRRVLLVIARWARLSGFDLVSARRRTIVPLWTNGRGYQFFRVRVRDQAGLIHKAWIRCPSFSSPGLDDLKVIWDEKPPLSKSTQPP